MKNREEDSENNNFDKRSDKDVKTVMYLNTPNVSEVKQEKKFSSERSVSQTSDSQV